MQQNESCAQTQAVTPGSEHSGVPLTLQQSPPPPHGPQSAGHQLQDSPPSHTESPQSGPQLPQSAGQLPQVSPASQLASPQTGPVPPPQSPQPPPSIESTHAWSHDVSQQKGSAPHTHASTPASAQPGSSLVSQHAPPPPPQGPQSASQVLQFSLGSQVASPQNGPPVQLPQPWLSTRPTQMSSQAVLQQNASATQTHVATVVLSHPGVPLLSQHEPVPPPHGPQSTSQPEHVSLAASHTPSPHTLPQGPQSAGQPAQSSPTPQTASPQISPPPPQVPHNSDSTSPVQVVSQAVSQQ